MKNITVSVDEITYRRARVRAAELDTSVSAEVKRFLEAFAQQESEFERLRKLEHKLRAEILGTGGISAGDRLSRDALYAAARSKQGD